MGEEMRVTASSAISGLRISTPSAPWYAVTRTGRPDTFALPTLVSAWAFNLQPLRIEPVTDSSPVRAPPSKSNHRFLFTFISFAAGDWSPRYSVTSRNFESPSRR